MSHSYLNENTRSRFLIEEESDDNDSDQISFELEYSENIQIEDLEEMDFTSKRSSFFSKKDFKYKEIYCPLKEDFVCNINVNKKWLNINNIMNNNHTNYGNTFNEISSNPREIHTKSFNCSMQNALTIQALDDLHFLNSSPKFLERRLVSKSTQTEENDDKKFSIKNNDLKPNLINEKFVRLNRRKGTDNNKNTEKSTFHKIKDLSTLHIDKIRKVEGRNTHKKAFIPSPGFSPIKNLELWDNDINFDYNDSHSRELNKKGRLKRKGKDDTKSSMEKLTKNKYSFRTDVSSNMNEHI